jgi:hypothetical protein
MDSHGEPFTTMLDIDIPTEYVNVKATFERYKDVSSNFIRDCYGIEVKD